MKKIRSEAVHINNYRKEFGLEAAVLTDYLLQIQ